MRCSKCTYSLWGITTGRCPECDTPFRPSDFRFRVRAVSFACPHCKTAYAGTSESGHLEPPEFECPTCKQSISMDQMVATPAPGVAEGDTLAFPNPWIDRRRLGRTRSFFKAAVEILIEPGRFMRSIVEQNPAPGSLSDAAAFAGIVALGYLAVAVGISLVAALLFGVAGAGRTASVMVGVGLPFLFALGFGVSLFIVPFIHSLLAHLFLRIFGAGAGGFRSTAQAFYYTAAVLTLLAIPAAIVPLGGLVLLAWQCYAVTMMLRESHRTTTGRAFAGTFGAIFVPMLVVAALLISMFVVATTATRGAVARARAIQSQALAQAASNATTIGMAGFSQSIAAVRERTGRWPVTPLDVTAATGATGSSLVWSIFGTNTDGAKIGTLTVTSILAGDTQAIADEAARLAALRTDHLSPFAMGATVFYYPASDGDIDDWLMVRRPVAGDPVYRVAGEWTELSYSDEAAFDKALATLNDARAKRKLIPLPHPRDVPALVEVSPARSIVPASPAPSLRP
ncbi:MAG: YIP1 family protein [Phycisphaerae bacterium]|nr:YIP1 family protein [Phycisphaerae bacterium]